MSQVMHAAERFTKEAVLSAMLVLDGQKLLLAQSEIHTLEPALDIETGKTLQNAAGWITVEGQRWPVYCLASDLTVLSAIPSARRVCVMIAKPDGYFGMLCDRFDTLRGGDLKLRPMPPCMVRPNSPIYGLFLHEGEVGLVSNSARLAAFLEDSEQTLMGSVEVTTNSN